MDNVTQIKLGDGRVLSLADWVYGSLRSAAIVSPYDDSLGYRRELFTYSRAMQIPGTNRYATAVHTNLPRSGDYGLPPDWEMIVFRLKATSDLPLEQAVVDFASQCAVRFSYNERAYCETSLIDLLLGGGGLEAQPGAHEVPIQMMPCLSFKMTVECDSQAHTEAFRRYLLERGPQVVDATVVAQFEQLARFAGGNVGEELSRIQNKLKVGHIESVDPEISAELEQLSRLAAPKVGEEILRVKEKLQPGRAATFWGHIEGYIKRAVF